MDMGNYSETSNVIVPVVRVMDAMVIIAGILGNSLVCAVFLSNYRAVSNSVTNKLIIHQSVIDLIAVILLLFARVIFHPEYLDVPTNPVASQLYCKVWYTEFILWGVYYTSTFNLVLIAIERYTVSCHIVWYRNFRLKGRIKFGFVIPWLLGFGSQIYLLVMAKSVYGWCLLVWPTHSSRIAGGISLFVLMFLLPLTVMCWCYSKIILTLWRSEAVHRQTGRNDNILKRSKNVATTLVLITVAYVICWLPAEADYLLFNLGLNDNYGGTVYYIFSILASLNMVVNPCIYTCKYTLFQRRLRKLFFPRGSWRRNRIQNVDPQNQAWP